METKEFYEKVKSRFSVLINKYGFEPVFELEEAGPFNLSQIIFGSEIGLIKFDVEYRDLDVGIMISFDAPAKNPDGTLNYETGIHWHHVVAALNGLGVSVDYDRLYKGITETESDAIVNRLLENWALELSPHWDRIVAGMGDPDFRKKLENLEPKGQHQKIIYFYYYGNKFAKEAAGGIFKSVLVIIGYLASFAAGLVLLDRVRNIIPGNLAMGVVLIPPFLLYLILRFYGSARKNQQDRQDMQ